jgi:hypothetical protein
MPITSWQATEIRAARRERGLLMMADITFIFDNPLLVMQASRVAWAIGVAT